MLIWVVSVEGAIGREIAFLKPFHPWRNNKAAEHLLVVVKQKKGSISSSLQPVGSIYYAPGGSSSAMAAISSSSSYSSSSSFSSLLLASFIHPCAHFIFINSLPKGELRRRSSQPTPWPLPQGLCVCALPPNSSIAALLRQLLAFFFFLISLRCVSSFPPTILHPSCSPLLLLPSNPSFHFHRLAAVSTHQMLCFLLLYWLGCPIHSFIYSLNSISINTSKVGG